MPIKHYKSSRGARKKASIVDRTDLYRGEPMKAKLTKKTATSGRGSAGKITTRHRGGGVKRAVRMVDFGQEKLGIPGRVEHVEFDPNRSAYLARIVYKDGERRYVLAWAGAVEGSMMIADEKTPEKDGNRMQLKNVTPGLSVHNVEIMPGRGGILFRSAGSYGMVMDVQGDHAQIKMASGEVRLISKECYATIGSVSNPDWRLQTIGSAGRNRRLGKRPNVRGKVMNPVDHPHGGGEGAQSIGLKYPKTKWGKHANGVKTRKPNRYSNQFILERRKSKKKK
ncbi:MAG: 50S ribosomal protein L2 [Candidatus Andersenbacteria bacterium]|nr:50S ribosomal protein L2 [Candidatus Andersenbacteria bacterium]